MARWKGKFGVWGADFAGEGLKFSSFLLNFFVKKVEEELEQRKSREKNFYPLHRKAFSMRYDKT